MNINTPIMQLLIYAGASVRLRNLLVSKLQYDLHPAQHLRQVTLSKFIDEYPVERLQKECFGFGRKAQAELRRIMSDSNRRMILGRRYAAYVATLAPKEKERTCVHCGCCDSRACPGGCSWAFIHEATATGVCTNCVDHRPAYADTHRSKINDRLRQELSTARRQITFHKKRITKLERDKADVQRGLHVIKWAKRIVLVALKGTWDHNHIQLRRAVQTFDNPPTKFKL